MGKRQYADVDSDKKRQSKIQKCELSTSSKLGVRLCGMQVTFRRKSTVKHCLIQVYQADSNRYIFTDKYRGRMLTVEEFHLSLRQYFYNGSTQRFDVLPEIIKRLESLYVTINSLLKYRFYSGSLLIVYDGSLQSNLIDVRMIDFANTILGTVTNDEVSNPHVGPDKGYLYGLDCLISFFRSILKDDERKREMISIDDLEK